MLSGLHSVGYHIKAILLFGYAMVNLVSISLYQLTYSAESPIAEGAQTNHRGGYLTTAYFHRIRIGICSLVQFGTQCVGWWCAYVVVCMCGLRTCVCVVCSWWCACVRACVHACMRTRNAYSLYYWSTKLIFQTTYG